MASRLGEYAAIPHSDEAITPSQSISTVPRVSDPSGAQEEHDNEQGGGAASRHAKPNLHHQLTFTNGLALVIGLQIGSGVFAAPAQVSRHVVSAAWGVSAWSLGGVLVWTGAASFIELGLAIPRNGGVQEYLQACYGDFVAFLFAWMWVVVVKPCAMAMVAIVFSDNLCRGLLPAAWVSVWLTKSMALTGLLVIAFINCLGAKTGAVIANGFLILKLLTVVSVASLGLSHLMFSGSEEYGGSTVEDPGLKDQSIWLLIGNYVTAVFGVLFCYGGWETVGFVAGDMKDPVRDLPRVINTAMVIVTIGFSLMAVALYAVIPIQSMRETSTPIVDFGSALFGALGRSVYSLTASACALGALHANVFATARLCVAAAQRSYFPPILANTHLQPGQSEPEYLQLKVSGLAAPVRAILLKIASVTAHLRLCKGVPIYAILLSSCPASLFILVGTFNGLVTFYGIVEYIFFFLAVSGLYQIRKDATLPSAYRTSTANPIVFCLLSAALVLRGVISDPLQGAAATLLIAAGYLLFRHSFRRLV